MSRSSTGGSSITHLSECGDSNEALISARGVLNCLNNKRQHLPDVHAQTGACNPRQLPSRGQHACHHSALSTTCAHHCSALCTTLCKQLTGKYIVHKVLTGNDTRVGVCLVRCSDVRQLRPYTWPALNPSSTSMSCFCTVLGVLLSGASIIIPGCSKRRYLARGWLWRLCQRVQPQ